MKSQILCHQQQWDTWWGSRDVNNTCPGPDCPCPCRPSCDTQSTGAGCPGVAWWSLVYHKHINFLHDFKHRFTLWHDRHGSTVNTRKRETETVKCESMTLIKQIKSNRIVPALEISTILNSITSYWTKPQRKTDHDFLGKIPQFSWAFTLTFTCGQREGW